jgi:sugar lactone lactonase YvrE
VRARVGIALALAATIAATVAPAARAGDGRPRWDTRVLALVPPPGYPARAYVAPNGRIYEGTYENPAGDSVPSRVLEYTGDGALLRSWTVQGQDLTQGYGVQVATSDALGRLVLLDKAPARALLLDPRTGEQTTYATFADIPDTLGQTPEPDYGVWGPDGSLYVGDYQQAVIWRVPPGGGQAQVWLADPQLDGGMFGTAGLALEPDGHTLLIAQGSEAGLGAGNPTTGRLFSLTIAPDGKPGPLRQLWESRPADAPDGIALAASGRIYVALVGPTNQIAVVNPDGSEAERFPQTPFTGDNGSPVPFDAVSSVMFLGTRLIVAQQSYEQGNAAHMAILDVEAGEGGVPELIPPNAGLRPGEQQMVRSARASPRRTRQTRPRHRARRHRRPARHRQ